MTYIAEEFMKERLERLYMNPWEEFDTPEQRQKSLEKLEGLNKFALDMMEGAEKLNWTQQDLFTEIITCGWDDLVDREYVLNQFIFNDHLSNRVRKLNK
jgi:hypothetical protein